MTTDCGSDTISVKFPLTYHIISKSNCSQSDKTKVKTLSVRPAFYKRKYDRWDQLEQNEASTNKNHERKYRINRFSFLMKSNNAVPEGAEVLTI